MRHDAGFVRDQTKPGYAPLVPEIALHLASEITPIWQATEAWLAEHNVDPPFWAFAWPGGQALARHVAGQPRMPRGPACARLRRRRRHRRASRPPWPARLRVEAAEIDPMARAAITLNAGANGVAVSLPDRDIVGDDCRWDLILCGDVCYEAPMTAHILPWLRRMARHAEVWLADPGRAYLPRDGLDAFASYRVATSLELEDRTERQVTLYRLCG